MSIARKTGRGRYTSNSIFCIAMTSVYAVVSTNAAMLAVQTPPPNCVAFVKILWGTRQQWIRNSNGNLIEYFRPCVDINYAWSNHASFRLQHMDVADNVGCSEASDLGLGSVGSPTGRVRAGLKLCLQRTPALRRPFPSTSSCCMQAHTRD